jgi:hypothetical protein
MKHFLLGVLTGSLFTGSLALAGTFYDRNGQPSNPRGSIQEFDYFRQRQLFLDASALRRNQEELMRQHRLQPCER